MKRSVKIGKLHERDALEYLKVERKLDIRPCGLFIDSAIAFLGATPDALIGEDGLVEVKCPQSCKDLSPEEGIKLKKITFWEFNKVTGEIGGIKKSHVFYYQIQGQLHITKRKYCLFVVWTPKGVKIERIDRDDEFWKTQMEQKLTDFYLNCILPELVDPRHKRSMEIRNPIKNQKKKK